MLDDGDNQGIHQNLQKRTITEGYGTCDIPWMLGLAFLRSRSLGTAGEFASGRR